MDGRRKVNSCVGEYMARTKHIKFKDFTTVDTGDVYKTIINILHPRNNYKSTVCIISILFITKLNCKHKRFASVNELMISVTRQKPLTQAEATFVLRIRQTQTARTKRLLEKVFMILLLICSCYIRTDSSRSENNVRKSLVYVNPSW